MIQTYHYNEDGTVTDTSVGTTRTADGDMIKVDFNGQIYATIDHIPTPMILDSENVAFFDVDETLIVTNYPPEDTHLAQRFTLDPKTFILAVPHLGHIQRLLQHKAWGNGVVVWSRSGAKWAEMVVKQLGLESMVDVILSKPTYYYDDKKCCAILGEHRYLENKE